MPSPLVAVEVGVERGGDERMQLDGGTFDQDRFKSLNAETVKRGCAVEQYWPVLDHILQCLPDFRTVAFDQAACTLHACGLAVLDEPCDHKRTEKFQCQGLRQTALIQFELVTAHDHAAAVVIGA